MAYQNEHTLLIFALSRFLVLPARRRKRLVNGSHDYRVLDSCDVVVPGALGKKKSCSRLSFDMPRVS